MYIFTKYSHFRYKGIRFLNYLDCTISSILFLKCLRYFNYFYMIKYCYQCLLLFLYFTYLNNLIQVLYNITHLFSIYFYVFDLFHFYLRLYFLIFKILKAIYSKINIHKLKSFYCQLFSFIIYLFIIHFNLLFYYDKYIKLLFNIYFLFSMFFASHFISYGLGINNVLNLISFIIMFTYHTKRKCLKVYLCLYIIMKVFNAWYFSNMKLMSRSHNTFYFRTFIKVQYIFDFNHYG